MSNVVEIDKDNYSDQKGQPPKRKTRNVPDPTEHRKQPSAHMLIQMMFTIIQADIGVNH